MAVCSIRAKRTVVLVVVASLLLALASIVPAAAPSAALPSDHVALVGVVPLAGASAEQVKAVALVPGGDAVAAIEHLGPVTVGTGPGALVLAPPVQPGRLETALARIRPDGSVVWSGALRGTTDATVYDVTATSDGTVHAVGVATGTLTVTGSAGSMQVAGAQSKVAFGFVAAYDAAGAVRWIRTVDGGTYGGLLGAAPVPGGGVVVTGMYGGRVTVGAAPTSTTLDAAPNTGRELVVARFGADGSVGWVVSGRGATLDFGRDVALDAAGNVYATGVAAGSMVLGSPPSAAVLGGAGAFGFVARFGPDGSFAWARQIGGEAGSLTLPWGIAVDAAGSTVAVSGLVQGAITAPAAGGPVSLPAAGDGDGLLVVLDAPTGAGRWAVRPGGTGADALPGVALGPDGDVLAAGWFDAPVTVGTTELVPVAGSLDGLLAAWAPDGTPRWARASASSAEDRFWALDAAGTAVVAAGVVSRTADVRMQSGSVAVSSLGSTDGVVAFAGLQANRAPTGTARSYTLAPGESVVLDPAAADADGDTVTVGVAAPGPSLGTVTATAPLPTYVADLPGTDELELELTDGFGGSTRVPVTIVVTTANRPPTAGDLAVTATAGVALPLTLPATDPDGDPLVFTIGAPTVGTVTGAGPAVAYTAPADAEGAAQFTYQVDDGRGGTATGTVTLTVVPPAGNRPPVPGRVHRSTSPGVTTTLELVASDPDGDPVTFELDGPGPSHGTLTGTPPQVVFTPDPGFRGTDSFTFTADDGRGGRTQGTATIAVRPPNIVVVMSDDQTFEQQRFLPKTNALLGDAGARFEDFVVSYSECCPSRATFLTGQYSHNHGVVSSALPTGGVTKLDDTQTLATWFDAAGYRTALAGKYLNGYGIDVPPTYVPPGWDDWFALYDPTAYSFFDYSVSVNGVPQWFGSDEADYSTDVLADHGADVIRTASDGAEPLFLVVTPTAPHSSTTSAATLPAPRHAGSLTGMPVPRPPNFDEVDVSRKPAAIRALPRLDPMVIAGIEQRYRRAAEALLSIDDLVETLVTTLEERGELDNTVLLFTSDNGYFYGEHRIPFAKSRPYEEAVRVPMLLRGPGIPAGSVVDRPTVNADLAPTLLELAGATPTKPSDGVSLLPYLRDPSYGARRSTLIENGPYPTRILYKAVRTERWVFISWATGERELYDLDADPYQLNNRAGDPAVALYQLNLSARLSTLSTCAGVTCRIGVT